MKYRKKPVVIEAEPVSVLLVLASQAWSHLPDWARREYDKGNLVFGDKEILIKTLEGTMTASYGDMVICGVKGELYPCKMEIFEATYEKVA